MSNETLYDLLTNPLFLAYEAAVFAAVAAPIWHVLDKTVDYLWEKYISGG